MKYLALLFLGLVAVNCNDFGLMEKFKAGNHLFSAAAYKEIKQTNSGNFIFCPLSAEIILALTRAGAGGNTGLQMSKGLHLPEDTHEVEQIFKELTPKLKSTKEYTLNSANRIYLKNNYLIREDFKNVARNSFSADVKNINFDNKKAAAAEISQWVSEQTHDKINNFIDSNMLSVDTRSVLVNALYFKGTWVIKFDEAKTKKKPFYVNKVNHVDVDMMEVTQYFGYRVSHELNAKILEMPYSGHDYSMVVVLPNEIDGLAQLENKMDEVLNIPEAYEMKVHVQIPKFNIETSIKLNDVLKKLGIRDAFENYADFSGFSEPGQQPLKISDVIQKAVIEVDEKGTTAAAATAVLSVVSYSSVRPTIQEFKADHPFIYYIKGPSGVMFIGRYMHN